MFGGIFTNGKRTMCWIHSGNLQEEKRVGYNYVEPKHIMKIRNQDFATKKDSINSAAYGCYY